MIIEILNVDYEDIKSLNNLDITNIMQYGKYTKNCALQNAFI